MNFNVGNFYFVLFKAYSVKYHLCPQKVSVENPLPLRGGEAPKVIPNCYDHKIRIKDDLNYLN
jgi:hypothetical protein